MKGVKILHCADLHFDTPFEGLIAMEAEKRREDLRETFGRIIDTVKEQSVSILLMAGDIFDNDRATKTTLQYLIKKMGEIPETKVFIAPGNHDPYTFKSFYTLLSWPQNVHIFQNCIEKVAVQELNVCVYGIALANPHEKQCLIRDFHVEEEDQINLMVLHGDVIGQGQTSDYNPITKEDIENSGLDYLALGHKHSFSGIQRIGSTHWAYCGNPEGRGFDELGPKGVIIGEVGKSYCNLEFMEICKRRYNEVSLDITGVITYEEIISTVREQIKDKDKHKNFYKITLTGEIDESFPIYTSVLWDKLKEDFHLLRIEDSTRILLDYAALEKEFSLKGIFIRKIKEKMQIPEDDSERSIMEQALKMGIRVLDEGKVELE